MTSDPTTPDRDRTGADLLARIDELTTEAKLSDYPDGNGTPVCMDCGNSSELCVCHERDDWCPWCGEPMGWCECYELEGDLP